MPRPWLRFGVVLSVAAVAATVGFGVSAAKPDERVQHLTGVYARAHVQKKEEKNDKYRHLRRQAEARFAEMGVQPTGEILVMRRELIKKANVVAWLIDRLAPTVFAQQYWEGGGEEVILESYYSGSRTVWLGWAYHESLSDGWWMSGDTKIDFAPSLSNPGTDPYVVWVDSVEHERDQAPRTSRLGNPVGWLAELFCPTLSAQAVACGAPQRAIFRSFVRAGFSKMRSDNTYNWMSSIFAGAAGGPAGFLIGSLGLFGASYGTGYMDAMWNYTKKCPGWYWHS